ncbi:MAG: 4-alpha-glucanotransferase [Ruminococcaceae bacterium]|nr:4-alpha-glucanotransferase [Oscillospiraceae bacterium]
MKRQSGVLLPVFSLPGEFGCGTFSRHAREFVKHIADGGFSLWQVLPFGITDSYHSPYMSLSSFGGNPWLIDPEELFELGLVTRGELEEQKVSDPYKCHYAFLEEKRLPFLKKAAKRAGNEKAVTAFLAENPEIAGTCRFLALREQNGLRPWTQWKIREPDEELLSAYGFMQQLFHGQWDKLHRFCADHGVEVIGDLPFYVSHDSYDVLSRPDSFWLDRNFAPVKVAGVPPDYFSPLGQKWGNPLYDWDAMAKDGFSYWKARLSYQLRLFDGVRFDHFRAASGYFAIPAEAENALEGTWLPGPGKKLIDAFAEVSEGKFLLAEDLGTIDEKTRDLLSYAGYPGMAVFQFGFDSNPLSPHLPHNYPENLVAYSGTHDNNTLLGFWFELEDSVREQASRYLGEPRDAVEGILRALLRSRAERVIFPLQDLLGYGADTRINTPGVAEGNWQMRFTAEQIASLNTEKFAEMNRVYARSL